MGESGLTIKQRDNFFDILKGIAIISVVIGHAMCDYHFSNPLQIKILHFVYIYHMVVFFFVSGYFFHAEPLDNPLCFFRKLIKNQYILWMKWGVFFVILDIFRGYSLKIIGNEMMHCITMRQVSSFSGAMWFVPWLILTQILLYGILYFTKKANKVLKSALLFFCAVAGMILAEMKIQYGNVDLAFVMTFIMWGGILYRQNKIKVDRFITSWQWAPIAVLILLINGTSNLQIEFSAREFYGYFGLFPMAFLGIWFCLSLAKLINGSKYITAIMANVGRYSYWIMALHFLIFKLIDQGYGKILYRLGKGVETEQLNYSPYSFPEMRVLYIALGISIPVLLGYMLDKAKRLTKESRR